MFLQVLWSLFSTYPGRTVNCLALFFTVAASALLVMTRLREQRALTRSIAGDAAKMDVAFCEQPNLDARTQRLNQFFYGFGSACLVCGLALSWVSTQL